MAERTKEQEREELYRAIWAIADELRGAVDGTGENIPNLKMRISER